MKRIDVERDGEIRHAADGIALVAANAFAKEITTGRMMVVEDVARIELAKLWIDADELWDMLMCVSKPSEWEDDETFISISRAELGRALSRLREAIRREADAR